MVGRVKSHCRTHPEVVAVVQAEGRSSPAHGDCGTEAVQAELTDWMVVGVGKEGEKG